MMAHDDPCGAARTATSRLIAVTLVWLGFIAAAAFAAGTPAVTYFDAGRVTAAFDKGAVLFAGDDANYMVHASRREAPGQCEIHSKDTDIIYVLAGATTFVTGGTCTDAQPTAPDEIRGTALQNGEARRLAKGDVIIVPSNTPHWFKEVDGTVLYYVVKVR
jgi:quercetin dioxygenase-like cupin family protein